MTFSEEHVVNPQLLGLARRAMKRAFVAGGDPAMTGQADPAAAAGGGTDPAAMGMDPAAMGMDPAATGGGGGGGGGGGDPAVSAKLDQMMQMMQAGGGAGGQGGQAIKPKIDTNVTLLQILKILARIADHLGIVIPASEMVATSGDLTGMAQQQQNPAAGGAAGIPPMPGMPGADAMQPTKAASLHSHGRPYDRIGGVSDKAAAMRMILERRRR